MFPKKGNSQDTSEEQTETKNVNLSRVNSTGNISDNDTNFIVHKPETLHLLLELMEAFQVKE